MSEPAIVWFRQDLRITDNPALSAALDNHERVIPVYIHAAAESGKWQLGPASRWWLNHSLKSLAGSLRELVSRLIIRKGADSLSVMQQLVEQTGARHVYWNRLYEPHHIERDRLIKQAMNDQGVEVNSFNATLLYEPWQISKNDGGPCRVFTTFWKTCVKSGLPGSTQDQPDHLPPVNTGIKSAKPESLDLLPRVRWDSLFSDHWQPEEAGAHQHIDDFLYRAVLN